MLKRFPIRRYSRNDRGNMAMMTALMMGVVMLGAGAALDYTLMANQSGDLQNVADAAVLAAARSGLEDVNELQKIAEGVVKAHNLSEYLKVVTRIEDDVIVVDITTEYEAVMSGMFGEEGRKMSVEAASPIVSAAPVNMALVVDTTGSMAGANIAALKTASVALLDELESAESESRVSIVPFGQYVNVGYKPKLTDKRKWIGRDKEGKPWKTCWINKGGQTVCSAGVHKWSGCMGTHSNDLIATKASPGSQQLPGAIDTNCGSEIMPLSDNFTAMKAKIMSLTTGGTTYLPSGLVWGWRTLDKEAPYTEAADTEDPNIMNAMLFMTDGANNRSRGDSYWSSSGTLHNYGSDGGKAGLQLTKDLCKAIKDDGIRIYVVAYKLPGSNSTKSILSECASGPDTFFEPENSQELVDTFKNVAKNLNQIRLAY